MKINSRGLLGYRLTQSYSRLESKHYLPDRIWTADKNSWPGDWEGRTILALVSLGRSTGKEPSYLEEILDLLPDRLNSLGYMGPVYPENQISEQQLSGNGWLLRGMVEYTKWKGEDRLIPLIRALVQNLYLPILDALDEYPMEKYEKKGAYSGSIIATRDRWLLSTDVGCTFISLDGISAACELLEWKELLPLLDGMISIFRRLDLYGCHYQTHATLSALRGILRTYRITGNTAYLDLAKDRFALYLEKGQTETYSNVNWFQDPRWTEPCAVTDSYMVAVELYQETKDPFYLETAQRIYLNSISHQQLPNGGMGIENCVGFDDAESLTFQKRKNLQITEAYWCCTMRGADGLSYVSEHQCLKEGEVYTLIHLFDCRITDGDTVITVKTKYPYTGEATLTVRCEEDQRIALRLFLPACMENVRINDAPAEVKNSMLELSARDGEEILVSFDVPLILTETRSGLVKAFHGPMLLGAPDTAEQMPHLTHLGNGVYEADDGRCFCSIGETVLKEEADVQSESLRVLFHPSKSTAI